MHDNWTSDLLRPSSDHRTHETWRLQVEELRVIGLRALTNPERLSMGEIQDLAWAFLKAALVMDRMR